MSENIMQLIQAGLHAPKSNTNAFGKYNYRSCEDIVEAVKPILANHGCHLNISDEMVMLGERFYIKATATVFQGETALSTACGWARESFSRKGMDDSQLTGSTSSYARKYALNGLFAIDDTKDADSQDNSSYEAAKQPITADQAIELIDMIKDADADSVAFLKYFGVAKVEDLPATLYKKARSGLHKKIADKEKLEGDKK